ncbi:Esterase SGNH hydrolase-type [Penicillium cf. viridicatum]|uniref:Esterase SGNH hydrolase-type n=1 Tax=Penicillium cf. viridicatum TaxID=2972119 RepID=A0A9W9MK01_9EURO|nr:Esterase SGNH hydrolase-type [Penicillium cf. viridicatum]
MNCLALFNGKITPVKSINAGETSVVSDRNNPETRLTHLADFKSQLQQWLDAEAATTNRLSEETLRSHQDRTIISEACGVLQHLWVDTLSERRGTTELKLILTQTADVTLLPGSRSAGGRYKDSVGILEEWNGKCEVAREWGHGTVYLDTKAFVTNAFVTGSFMRQALRRRMG